MSELGVIFYSVFIAMFGFFVIFLSTEDDDDQGGGRMMPIPLKN